MRVLQVVKTSDGMGWAAWLATSLVAHGVEVHVALPNLSGRFVSAWRESGSVLHTLPTDIALGKLGDLSFFGRIRDAVKSIEPDLIHTHHVSSTIAIRLALRKRYAIPRIFQVHGPLHLEHVFPRTAELLSSGQNDYWIATSQHIVRLYRKARIPTDRIFQSYVGFHTDHHRVTRSGKLRAALGVPDSHFLIGNASFIYPPRYALGHVIGIKCHEDLIDAFASVIRSRTDVHAVLIGGAWGCDTRYEDKLRRRSARAGRGRIHMLGSMPLSRIQELWPDFDCAVHVPISENCGGVVEPLAACVPVISSRVGGLPEVVIDEITGKTTLVRNPHAVSHDIMEVLERLVHYRALAQRGSSLVRRMFDVRRTSAEVLEIYKHILNPSSPRPSEFDPIRFLGCDKESFAHNDA